MFYYLIDNSSRPIIARKMAKSLQKGVVSTYNAYKVIMRLHHRSVFIMSYSPLVLLHVSDVKAVSVLQSAP